MAKQRRTGLDPASVQEVMAPIVNSEVQPREPAKGRFDIIIDALGAAAPLVKTIAQKGIQKKAKDHAITAELKAKEIQELKGQDLDGTLKEWRKAVNEDPTILALNPHAQQKARRDIARASARALEPEILEEVNKIGNELTAEDDFEVIATSLAAIRNRHLTNLGYDAEEALAFNSEFNQIEQNFTAQFNAKDAQLKRQGHLERFSDLIHFGIQDGFHPAKPELLEDAIINIGARLTDTIKGFEQSGAMLRGDRNNAVIRSVSDSIVEQHQKTGKGYELLDGGLLAEIKLSIDDKGAFNLQELKQGAIEKDIRARLARIDKVNNSMLGDDLKDLRSQTRAEYTKEAFDLFSQPVVDHGALQDLMQQSEDPQMKKLMGADWPSKVTSIMSAQRTLVRARQRGELEDGKPSIVYSQKWAPLLSDKTSGDIDIVQASIDQQAGKISVFHLDRIVTEHERRTKHGAKNLQGFLSNDMQKWDMLEQGLNPRDGKLFNKFISDRGLIEPQLLEKREYLLWQGGLLERDSLVDAVEAAGNRQERLEALNALKDYTEQFINRFHGNADVLDANQKEAILNNAESLKEIPIAQFRALSSDDQLEVMDKLLTPQALKQRYPEMTDFEANKQNQLYNKYVRSGFINPDPAVYEAAIPDLNTYTKSLESMARSLNDVESIERNSINKQIGATVSNYTQSNSQIERAKHQIQSLYKQLSIEDIAQIPASGHPLSGVVGGTLGQRLAGDFTAQLNRATYTHKGGQAVVSDSGKTHVLGAGASEYILDLVPLIADDMYRQGNVEDSASLRGDLVGFNELLDVINKNLKSGDVLARKAWRYGETSFPKSDAIPISSAGGQFLKKHNLLPSGPFTLNPAGSHFVIETDIGRLGTAVGSLYDPFLKRMTQHNNKMIQLNKDSKIDARDTERDREIVGSAQASLERELSGNPEDSADRAVTGL